jgi:hypothetical protein
MPSTWKVRETRKEKENEKFQIREPLSTLLPLWKIILWRSVNKTNIMFITIKVNV